MAEVDAAAAEMNRLRTWVDRSTGGRLGHYPYGQIVAIPADRLTPITSEEAFAAQRERDAAPGIELIA